jgi:hypothetical protein
VSPNVSPTLGAEIQNSTRGSFSFENDTLGINANSPGKTQLRRKLMKWSQSGFLCEDLYLFSTVDVTKHQKTGWLKQQKFFLSWV